MTIESEALSIQQALDDQIKQRQFEERFGNQVLVNVTENEESSEFDLKRNNIKTRLALKVLNLQVHSLNGDDFK
jgi:hypothetical protein